MADQKAAGKALLVRSRRTWRFRTGGEYVEVIRRADLDSGEASPGEERNRRPQLESWLADPLNVHSIVEMFQSCYGFSPFSPGRRATHDDLFRVVKPRLEAAFRSGELLLLFPKRRLPPVQFGSAATESELQRDGPRGEDRQEAPEQPVPQKTWVEIQLVNEQGSPVPNQMYLLTLPNGKTVTGTLDAAGSVRLDDIDPGNCKLVFPDLDAKEWNWARP